MNDFSFNLKKYRTERGISRKEMAKLLYVSLSTYTNYEAGNREPKLDAVIKMAVILKVSTDELLGYESFQKQEQRYKTKYFELLRIINRIHVISDIGGNL